MNIEVKGINSVLVIKCQENIVFNDIIEDLEKFLDQPLFNQDGYYPRAFFDFGCRQLEENDIKNLIQLLSKKKKVLFDGISLPLKYQQVHINQQQIHNGEEIYVYQETLFLGVINKGATVYCHKDVYFLNEVKGTIVAMNGDIKIYGHHFTNAQIIINRKILQDLTTSAFVSIYDRDDEIVCNEEDDYDKNHCFDFG